MWVIIGWLLGWFVGSWAAYIYCWCLYVDESDDSNKFNFREFLLTPLTMLGLIIKEAYLYVKSLKNKRK